MSKLPFFGLRIRNDPQRTQLKDALRNANAPVGHCLSWREITLHFLGLCLSSRRLEEGISSTAFQFYLNRPLKYLSKFLNSNPTIARSFQSGFVFDPGCGCGKHLMYLKDNFNSETFGVDIYEIAIEVAKIVDLKNEGRFIQASAFDFELLKNELPDQIDVLLIDSWLKHVADYPELEHWFQFILPKTRYALTNIGTKERELFVKFFGDRKIVARLSTEESDWYFIDLSKMI
ncbi:class I SAM-dependent methyltransferase [Alphaproteobacteria bacterium]|nr:class I SAM-dependent methyltransferase [Alphaproteobacteria bacterium]